MKRIAICDDEEIFLQAIKQNIHAIIQNNEPNCVIDTFQDGAGLLKAAKQEPYQLIFLDIELPESEEAGFGIAHKLNQELENVLIVFCTNHNELVYDSFVCQPFWFICKENYSSQLARVLAAAEKRLQMRNPYWTVRANGAMHTLAVKDMIYIECFRHNVNIKIHSGESLCYREKLSKLETELAEYGFVRVNYGCLVNMSWIRRLGQSDVELREGTVLPVSRGRKQTVRSQFHKYIKFSQSG